MAEQFFDYEEIDTRHNEMTGKGMPEIVEGEIFDAGPPTGGVKGSFDIVKSPPRCVSEHIWTIDPSDQALEVDRSVRLMGMPRWFRFLVLLSKMTPWVSSTCRSHSRDRISSLRMPVFRAVMTIGFRWGLQA